MNSSFRLGQGTGVLNLGQSRPIQDSWHLCTCISDPFKMTLLTICCLLVDSNERMPERIRPLPKRLPSGRFILCVNADGSCRHGDDCTYAHSKVEQDAWNSQLAESEDDSKSESEFLYTIVSQIFYCNRGYINVGFWTQGQIRPLPKRLLPGKKFSLCKNADGSCHHGEDCTFAHSKVEQDAWNAQLAESEDDSKSESEFLYPTNRLTNLLL